MEHQAPNERVQLTRRLETLEARNEQLRRLLVEAYGRLDELESRPRLGAALRRAGVRGRLVARTKAPRLARLYREVRARIWSMCGS